MTRKKQIGCEQMKCPQYVKDTVELSREDFKALIIAVKWYMDTYGETPSTVCEEVENAVKRTYNMIYGWRNE